MTKLNILYLGPDEGTSHHRFHALRRLGHSVRLINPYVVFTGKPRMRALGFKTGYAGFENAIEQRILSGSGDERYDVVWVDNGEYVGKHLALELKKRCDFLLVHNLDNPFTARDGWRWRLFRRALPVYDLFVTPRQTSRAPAIAQGAKRALSVMFSADEVVHRKAELDDTDLRRFGSEVVFVGTWMPERGPFMQRLLERGVPLKIFGPRWTKAPEYPSLEPVVLSRELQDVDYVKAISAAKIALGLLSKGNQDLHTTRSLEIPSIGTVFCAPRTVDHESLYVDRSEALFFNDADECADLCLSFLQDDTARARIGAAGHARALENGHFNERLCAEILNNL